MLGILLAVGLAMGGFVPVKVGKGMCSWWWRSAMKKVMVMRRFQN